MSNSETFSKWSPSEAVPASMRLSNSSSSSCTIQPLSAGIPQMPYATCSRDSINNNSNNEILDQISCPVCLEIMVHPQTLSPCGHACCGSCLDGVHDCPTCRQKATSRIPATQLESLIETLVNMGVVKNDQNDDVQQFRKRMKQETRRGVETLSAVPEPRKRLRTTWTTDTPTGTVTTIYGMTLPTHSTLRSPFSSATSSFSPSSNNPSWHELFGPSWQTGVPAASTGNRAQDASSSRSMSPLAIDAASLFNFDPMVAPVLPPYENRFAAVSETAAGSAYSMDALSHASIPSRIRASTNNNTTSRRRGQRPQRQVVPPTASSSISALQQAAMAQEGSLNAPIYID